MTSNFDGMEALKKTGDLAGFFSPAEWGLPAKRRGEKVEILMLTQ